MWLPKDERLLLRNYFVKIGEFGMQHEFSSDDLLGFIKSKVTSHPTPSADDPQDVKGIKALGKDLDRIIIANKALEKRGLITSPNLVLRPSEPTTISLTITGYDLGRKYNSRWLRIKLWYAEYIKDHPIWVIVGFLCGVISTLLINWLSTYLQRTPGAK